MSDAVREAAELGEVGVQRVRAAATLDELAAIDTELLGKKGRLGQLKASLRDAEPAQRKQIGQALNEARSALEAAIDERRESLSTQARREVLLAEAQDLTEALGRARVGHVHPITQTWEQLEDVFVGMGFSVEDGPEIETDWFNFEALNLPVQHPARSLWDTLYVDTSGIDGLGDDEVVLRTHTSPVQIRAMLRAVRDSTGPPIYVVCPGRVYRRDTADSTHLPVFHQIEGLVVDRGISMGDLAGTIEEFTRAYFGEAMTSRLRPSYFPFTEPSAEVDISQVDGSWLEMGGCGMVHPNVLRHCGLDPEEWTGFAFGFGIDRLAKIRHDVADLRDFVTNDIRFLEQF
ncbi:MAG: phenylalanine--tRNA ligase subunit alpha [Microthrixaceae bacterium]